MQTPSGMAAKVGYALLSIEALALVTGAVWYGLHWDVKRPEVRPSFHAIAFSGASPFPSFLVTRHSAGRDVLRTSAVGKIGDAMLGDPVDRLGDCSELAGMTMLHCPEDPRWRPVVRELRLTPDRGQLRLLAFGPGAFLEGIGDPEQKGFPLESGPEIGGMSVVQLVRCQVAPGKTLDTLELAHPEGGGRGLGFRAHPDGSFEVRLGPEAAPLRVGGPPGTFVIVSLTWNPKPGHGTCRFAVRPVQGQPRQAREAKIDGTGAKRLTWMRLGQKLEAGAGSAGTMDLVESLVFQRELSPKEVARIEDWLGKQYFPEPSARPN
jgi:hypothetical protein